MTQESRITQHEGGGITVSGPDAIAAFRAFTLASALRLYNKTGILPTRGVTPKYMLGQVTKITRKPYKNSAAGREEAAADAHKWAVEMRDAIPSDREDA